MKKSLFLIPCLAAALWSCSDKDVVGPENDKDQPTDAGYLAIRIAGANESYSRADDEKYEDGIASEWAVKNIRFFFFTDKGDVSRCVLGETYYADIVPEGSEQNGHENISGDLNAVVVLQSPAGDKPEAPAYIVAVCNPPKDFGTGTGTEIKRFSDLQTLREASGLNGSTIIMSNSVYHNEKKGDSADLEHMVEIKGHVKNTKGEAQNDPVTIYVDRVPAKVSVIIGEDLKKAEGKNFYELTPAKTDDNLEVEKTKLYVRLDGWNVTATASETYGIKNLEKWKNYEVENGPFAGWNKVSYFRSFWATNPDDITYNYGKYENKETENDPTVANYLKGFADEGTDVNYTYVNENAFEPGGDNTEHNPQNRTTATTTKAIFAATIVNSNGDPVSFAEFAGERILLAKGGTYSEEPLLTTYAKYSNIYVRTGDGETEPFKYTRLAPSDLKLMTSFDIKKNNEDAQVGALYYTYAQLINSNLTYTLGNDENAEEIDADKVNQILISLGGAKVWKDGKTYYYHEIEHLNKTGKETDLGYYGVIRNHWYQISISKIVGFGTPVFKPEETIYPIYPEPETTTYLSAEIKILSWRLVPQSSTLGK